MNISNHFSNFLGKLKNLVPASRIHYDRKEHMNKMKSFGSDDFNPMSQPRYGKYSEPRPPKSRQPRKK